jgi:predicted DNA-binding protein (MmcQ/YjbR family)
MPRSTSDAIAAHALSLPEAWEDHPWGDRVAKVRKKVFAMLPSDAAGSLGVKLPRSGGFALSLATSRPMAYGLGKHGWVTVPLDDPALPDIDVLRDWVTESYRAVAPKTLARLLGITTPP